MNVTMCVLYLNLQNDLSKYSQLSSVKYLYTFITHTAQHRNHNELLVDHFTLTLSFLQIQAVIITLLCF